LRPTGGFYAPSSGDGVVVRVRYDDADGWMTNPDDGYIKTEQQIPFDRVDSFEDFGTEAAGAAADIGRAARGKNIVDDVVQERRQFSDAGGLAASSRVRVTPDMDPEEFLMLPRESYAELSVLEVPPEVRNYWANSISSTEKDNIFFTTLEVPNSNKTVPVLDYDNANEIKKFVDNSQVAPFRQQIAQELSQPLSTRLRTSVGLPPARYAKNPVSNRQYELIGRSSNPARVENMGDALAHWQFVGNQNIQSLLRTGDVNLPFGENLFDETVYLLTTPRLGGTFADETAVTQYFVDNAQESIRYLDEFIQGSTGHGGFTGFRGVTSDNAASIFGVNDVSELSDSLVGARISDPGYSAVSVSPSRAAGFATIGPDNQRINGIVFMVDVPASLPAGSVSGSLDSFGSAWNREYEMLLPRGTEYEIIDVVTDRNLLTYDTIDAIVRIRPVP
jgi:hypothetical protein